MKRISVAIMLIAVSVWFPVFGQNRWVEDNQLGFKISVPANYSATSNQQGGAKIYAFMSPDQNVAVLINSYSASPGQTIDNVISDFLRDIIKGAVQLTLENSTMNGVQGKAAGYKWRTNNKNTVVLAFYALERGFAYIVWSLIPEDQFNKRAAEAVKITDSFTLLNSGQSVAGQTAAGQSGSGQTAAGQQVTEQSIAGHPASLQSPSVQLVNWITDSSGYSPLVSDDALIKHLIPPHSSLTSSEPGQSVWNITGSDKKITMVIQNIKKDGRSLNLFMNQQATMINNQPEAFMRYQNYSTVNDLNICNYWYENKGNVFIYTVVDGPASFYMIGFVGSLNCEGELEAIHKRIYPTIRRSDKSDNPSSELAISSASLSSTLSGSNDITPLSIKVGTSVNSLAGIDNEVKMIPPSAKRIHMVMDYTGGEVKAPFRVRWSSRTHDCLIVEESYLPRVHNMNRIHSYIDNRGNDWPVGDYVVMVWHGDRMVTLSTFSIGSGSVVTLQTPSTQTASAQSASTRQATTNQAIQTQTTTGQQTSSTVAIKQIVMDNQNNGYDFATGKLKSAKSSPDPDVLNEPWSTALPGIGGNWAKTDKSRMEDVTAPPSSGYISDGYDFMNAEEAPLNKVLVFKLKNGKYAKFMIIKDEFSRSSGSSEHKITCLVQYPAF